MRKPKVLYCDDQQSFRDDFVRRHSNNMEIKTLSDIGEVINALDSTNFKPDILLLDLYHPLNIANQQEKAALAQKKLEELRDKITEVKKFVDQAWAPAAIDVLREIRRKYKASKLPVLVYTQRGLSFMDDKQLREVEKMDADWLIKDFQRVAPATEELRIKNHIRVWCKKKRFARDITIALIFTIFGSIINYFIG